MMIMEEVSGRRLGGRECAESPESSNTQIGIGVTFKLK